MGETSLTSVNRVKLLGIHIDRRLNFDYYFSQLCKKANKKLHSLTRICKCVDQKRKKRRALMFHSRNMKHHINKFHERALKLVYNDTPNLRFDEFFENNPQLVESKLQSWFPFISEILH